MKRRNLLIFALPSTVLVMALAGFTVMPARLESNRLGALVGNEEERFADLERARAGLDALDRRAGELASMQAWQERRIPRGESERDRYKYFHLLERSLGVEVISCRESDDQEAEGALLEPWQLEDEEATRQPGFDGVPLDLVVEGEFEGLTDFLDFIQFGPRLFTMEAVRLDGSKRGRLRLELRITAVLPAP